MQNRSAALCVLAFCAVACDFGGVDLGGGNSSGDGPGVSSVGRRVQVGFDNGFEVCPGNLARWSADLDRVDQYLLITAEPEVATLLYFEEEEGLLDACSNSTGCYHERPEGPETVEQFEELDGRDVYWFVFDRLEVGWSASLPPFLRHGTASALTSSSCDPGSASLTAVLNKGPVEGLALNESRAAGQWIRLMLERAGPALLEEFASKLDGASSEAYIRSVFAEVYGLPMDVTWEDAAATAQLPPPGGWCRTARLPFFDGSTRISEVLDCSGPRTQVHGDGSHHVVHTLVLDEPERLLVEGELPAGVELTIESCGCETATFGQTLTPGEALELDAGSWRIRLRSEEANPAAVDLELNLVGFEND